MMFTACLKRPPASIPLPLVGDALDGRRLRRGQTKWCNYLKYAKPKYMSLFFFCPRSHISGTCKRLACRKGRCRRLQGSRPWRRTDFCFAYQNIV